MTRVLWTAVRLWYDIDRADVLMRGAQQLSGPNHFLKGMIMTGTRWTIAAAFVCGLLVTPALATELGDPAPPLKISKWVKGDAVDLAKGKGKNIYVVEFWATWCGPCIRGIPHLTEMQEAYKEKGVIFIGVSNEKPGKVTPFVKKMGDKMDYTVAVDKNKATSQAYMGAFKVNSIPHAFIVDREGNLAWHGHPMAEMDKVLDDIIAKQPATGGSADDDAKLVKARKYQKRYFKLARKSKKSSKLAKTGRRVMKYGSHDAEFMCAFAMKIIESKKVKHRDLKLARKAAKAAVEATDEEDCECLAAYALALFKSGKMKSAIARQEEAIDMCENDELLSDLKKTLKRYKRKAKEA